jgi:hypothetical protein
MFCVRVAALRRTDPPSTKSYQLPVKYIDSRIILNGNRSEGLTHQAKEEEEEEEEK